MKLLYILISVIAIHLVAVSSVYSKEAPTAPEVKEELGKLLKKYDFTPPKIRVSGEWKQQNSDFSLGPFFSQVLNIILYVILGVLAAALVIYIIRIIIEQKTDRSKTTIEQLLTPEDNGEPDKETSLARYYKAAKQSAENGQFNRAIIQLHKGTIVYLAENLLIKQNKKYTNRDLKNAARKSDKKLYQALSFIIRYAEYAAFSEVSFTDKEYTLVLNTFEGSFI